RRRAVARRAVPRSLLARCRARNRPARNAYSHRCRSPAHPPTPAGRHRLLAISSSTSGATGCPRSSAGSVVGERGSLSSDITRATGEISVVDDLAPAITARQQRSDGCALLVTVFYRRHAPGTEQPSRRT